ncbi:MAG: DUF2807 domain-containing protein [Pseudomonadaceae bacterium]|nr:DUF2807 domain-containing protein [Pseudomonadaceae bacterium]
MTNGKNLAGYFRLIALFFAGLVLSVGCSPLDADVIEESVELNERFSALRVEIAGDVTLKRADSAGRSTSADVTATSDDADALTFEVSDETLTIGSKERDWRWSSEPVRITLYYERLDSLTVAGSGDISAGSLAAESLKLVVLGSGDIELEEVDADSVTAQVQGSGDIEVAGNANELRASVMGSGDIDAQSLTVQKAVASVAGSGDIELTATAHLEASVAGSGDIRYTGTPEVSQRVVGSGEVSPAS